MDELLIEFKAESLNLLVQMREILDHVEDHPEDGSQMEQFGQLVDRIMGGAKSLALALPKEHPMHAIGAFGEICKILGYKSSQLNAKNQLLLTTVAFLYDAVDAVESLVRAVDAQGSSVSESERQLNATFLDRLRWIAKQFDADLRATVALNSTETQIKNLLSHMGLRGGRNDE